MEEEVMREMSEDEIVMDEMMKDGSLEEGKVLKEGEVSDDGEEQEEEHQGVKAARKKPSQKPAEMLQLIKHEERRQTELLRALRERQIVVAGQVQQCMMQQQENDIVEIFVGLHLRGIFPT